jgi:hypothetical protein
LGAEGGAISNDDQEVNFSSLLQRSDLLESDTETTAALRLYGR